MIDFPSSSKLPPFSSSTTSLTWITALDSMHNDDIHNNSLRIKRGRDIASLSSSYFGC